MYAPKDVAQCRVNALAYREINIRYATNVLIFVVNSHQGEEEEMLRGIYFLRNEQPSVKRALPPVGWQRTVVQPWQMTTVWACEKTVVMVKQPGHLTSMKKERGAGTRVYLVIMLARADRRAHELVW